MHPFFVAVRIRQPHPQASIHNAPTSCAGLRRHWDCYIQSVPQAVLINAAELDAWMTGDGTQLHVAETLGSTSLTWHPANFGMVSYSIPRLLSAHLCRAEPCRAVPCRAVGIPAVLVRALDRATTSARACVGHSLHSSLPRHSVASASSPTLIDYSATARLCSVATASVGCCRICARRSCSHRTRTPVRRSIAPTNDPTRSRNRCGAARSMLVCRGTLRQRGPFMGASHRLTHGNGSLPGARCSADREGRPRGGADGVAVRPGPESDLVLGSTHSCG